MHEISERISPRSVLVARDGWGGETRGEQKHARTSPPVGPGSPSPSNPCMSLLSLPLARSLSLCLAKPADQPPPSNRLAFDIVHCEFRGCATQTNCLTHTKYTNTAYLAFHIRFIYQNMPRAGRIRVSKGRCRVRARVPDIQLCMYERDSDKGGIGSWDRDNVCEHYTKREGK